MKEEELRLEVLELAVKLACSTSIDVTKKQKYALDTADKLLEWVEKEED